MTENLGHWGEQIAAAYVTRTLGWKIVSQNWRCRWGELDIVAQARCYLVVVEVKTRRGIHYGTPLESVDDRKCKQLWRLTRHFMQQYQGIEKEYGGIEQVRIDVIGIQAPHDTVERFVHIRNAVHL